MLLDSNEAKISALRIISRCNELAKITCEDIGITRLYLSKEHLIVNKLVGQWMKESGMSVWQDAVGNICGRYNAKFICSPAVILGSHLDTVKNAGRYDGILGVLSGIEIVYWLNKKNIRLELAIEVIGFGDEEGARFGITLLGSRGITGTWKNKWLSYTDNQGISIEQAMIKFGLNIKNIYQASRDKKDIAAYVELHIEQGPCLEQENLPIGVVTNIHGARRFKCSFIGESGHAGTVPMKYRKDALFAFAEWMKYVEYTTIKKNSQLVATVGMISCNPGSTNVIPGIVNFSLDIRGPQDIMLESLSSLLLKQGKVIANNRHLIFEYKEYYRTSEVICDSILRNILCTSIQKIQGKSILLPSGAGHDAIAISERWPVAMLFIRNYRGISHNPEESVDINDIALSLQAYSDGICNIIKKKAEY
ncbi:allantoate amidohydrolase [Candidatus Pantoea edessiphila]|uniref:Allantoate amidohydrolase n=1 Tax=Candidatus Pantoea edessiphila TaxID=2044610 RepID=A0A2P5SXE9_9GAMM|nr:allantoate amidohydrolase [Candidatus Pantoea edessiphila]MBK4775813.1 allantoate amidohydrolase [Pantoea sp. Edef]PPI87005.1 allantoate amidohydrolase [Candidatus Pantoea edessiphila]